MSKTYPMFKVHIDIESALSQVRNVLESGYINEGQQVADLTAQMREILENQQLTLVNSCTSALTLALKIAGVGPGSNVITTPVTCVASNSPIINLGGKIIWADITPHNGSLDPDDVIKKITPSTKAVLCVAWAGIPGDLDRLYQICKQHKVPLILDAAHAFGATYQGQQVNHFADFTCYSFQAIKHITCGDGGAIICKHENDFKQAKKLKWFGYDREAVKDASGNWRGQSYDIDIAPGDLGFKFNMNNLSAAIGLSQLKHIKKIMTAHRENAQLYNQIFAEVPFLKPLQAPANSLPSYWVYTLLLNDKKINRDQLLQRLNDEHIAAGVVHIPNNVYSCFEDSHCELPGVEYFASRQISLPVGWWLEAADIKHIAQRVITLCAERD
ncbi:MAG: DegT/DnrJ/EryC1/StrS aminotransferase family protein [Gammaproteobacteria bacterium]